MYFILYGWHTSGKKARVLVSSRSTLEQASSCFFLSLLFGRSLVLYLPLPLIEESEIVPVCRALLAALWAFCAAKVPFFPPSLFLPRDFGSNVYLQCSDVICSHISFEEMPGYNSGTQKCIILRILMLYFLYDFSVKVARISI